jgi:hypothetical protein
MKSILLDRTTWGPVIDSSRNIAVCTEPYAIAQDVACAVRTFKGECWYDVTKGIPYLEEVFGSFSPALYAALVNKEALTVPLVDSVKTVITSFKDRRVTGQIQITDVQENTATVSLGDTPVIPADPPGRYLSSRYVSPSYVR